jgi:hypothetical protein
MRTQICVGLYNVGNSPGLSVMSGVDVDAQLLVKYYRVCKYSSLQFKKTLNEDSYMLDFRLQFPNVHHFCVVYPLHLVTRKRVVLFVKARQEFAGNRVPRQYCLKQ